MKRRRWTAAFCAAALATTCITGASVSAAGLNTDFSGTQSISVRAEMHIPIISFEKLSDTSVNVSWTYSEDMDAYQYDIASDPEFTNIMRTNDAYVASVKMTGLQEGRSYYFRVRSHLGSQYSEYVYAVITMPNPSVNEPFPGVSTTEPVTEPPTTEPVTEPPTTEPVTEPIQLQTPNLRTEPLIDELGRTVENSVKLLWDAIPNAAGYEYQFAYDPGFNAIIKENDTQKIELKLVNLAPGTHYYIRIRAFYEVNGQRNYSEYGMTEVLIPEAVETTTTEETTTTTEETTTTTEETTTTTEETTTTTEETTTTTEETTTTTEETTTTTETTPETTSTEEETTTEPTTTQPVIGCLYYEIPLTVGESRQFHVTINGEEVDLGSVQFYDVPGNISCTYQPGDSFFTVTATSGADTFHKVPIRFTVGNYTEVKEIYLEVPDEVTTPARKRGDLNGDDLIDTVDAADLLIAIASQGAGQGLGLSDEQTAAADTDGNGSLTAMDATIILQYAAYYGSGGRESLETFLANNL